MTGKRFTSEQFEIAFWSKTKPVGDCLIWTGKMSKHTQAKGGPRGLVKRNRRWCYAHKVALEMKLGRPVVRPLQANHHCDEPLCVEWNHLYEGTQAQNVEDRIRRGRSGQYGETHTHATLTEPKVREIKELLALGVLQQDIADQFGVTNQAISRINRGLAWSHVIVAT